MRPLVHPPVEDMSVEGILYALSDPVRVRLFIDLMSAECAQSCAACGKLNATPMPKSTLSQHFKILREAGLIHSERKGVELQSRPRWDEYGKKYGAMISGIIEAYADEIKGSSKSVKAARSKR